MCVYLVARLFARHRVLKDPSIYATLLRITMNPKFTTRQIDQLIDEYVRSKHDLFALEIAIPETALYIEETFDIRLSDSDMTPETLTTPEAIKALVQAKLAADGGAG
jgi:hypothetical protein